MDNEKKMTEAEIIKALECCEKDGPCLWENECPLRNDKDCHVTLSREALALVNKYKQEAIREREEGVRLFEMLTERIQKEKGNENLSQN